ncbi:MAG: radical SAM protein [Candidatus Kerfeldbacteria bacterium]|nr:radical SAM protein [Candidatus Kerfeldbacteria bacterium]
MSLSPLSFANIISIAETWHAIGGALDVEIGALEPLLWRDGERRIHDVVAALTQRGYTVSLTTNGHLLERFAEVLICAGLSLIRTSWHSTDPVLFREISGGHGEYEQFMRGVTTALAGGIRMAFNRVLMRGFTDDLGEQIGFIERHNSRLKLYTLLWTPQSAAMHDELFQRFEPVVERWVMPRTRHVTTVEKEQGRSRTQYHLTKGGMVEVKRGDQFDRSVSPCASCAFKDKCDEGFGDYVRVDPRLHLYFCYMRRDLGFPIAEYLGRPEALKQRLREMLLDMAVESFLAKTPLRFTVTPFCNFNCRVPGAAQGWCMEEPGEFIYPKIRPTLLGR